jgi:hypothetical protein
MLSDARTYSTGVQLTRDEFDRVTAGAGYVLIQPRYHWDHIDLGHTIIDAHQFGVERRAPYSGIVHSVGKPLEIGYGYANHLDLESGDNVWMKNYTSYFAMGQTNVGTQKNMGVWYDGIYLMAVRHQELVARARGFDLVPLNGFVFFTEFWPNGEDKKSSWTGVLANDISWASQGEKIILRMKPHALEYEEVRTKEIWYCSPRNVIGVWR